MLRARPWLLVAIAAGAIGLYLVISHLGSRIDRPLAERSTPRRTHLPREPHTRTSREDETDPAGETAADAPRLVRIDLDGEVDISGRVLTPKGAPLSGAKIICAGSRGQSERGTDEKGCFEFTMRPASEFVLLAEHPKYGRAIYGPFELERDHALREIDMTMPSAVFLTGMVTDEHGVPVESASVFFRMNVDPHAVESEIVARLLSEPIGVRTDAYGEYSSPGLRVGMYEVVAVHQHYLDAEEQTVELVAGKAASGVDLVLKEGVTISGWVLDWDGKGFARVRLEAYASDETVRYAQYGGRKAFTDEEGAFLLRGLEAGAHDLIVSLYLNVLYRTTCSAPAEGIEIKVPAPPRIKGRVVDKLTKQPVEKFLVWTRYGWDRAQSEDHPDGRFELICRPGECGVKVERAPGYASAVVHGLRPIDGVKPVQILVELIRGTTLTFHVTSAEDGSAVAAATVLWEEGYVLDGTDAEGKCVAANVPPGRHEFEFHHPDFALKHVVVEVAEQESERQVNVVLDKGLTIRGRVVTSVDGTPVPAARVMLTHADMFLWEMYDDGWVRAHPDPFELDTRTDELGAFTIDRVTLEEYGLYVWHEGYVPFKKVTRFSEGFEEELLVEITAGGRIVGTVSMNDGTPVEYAEVCLDEPAPGSTRHRADANGHYEITNVEPGSHWLGVEAGHLTVTRSALVREGQETRVDIVLGGAAVFGRVTRAGKPVSGLDIRARPSRTSFGRAEGVSASSETDEEGLYRIDSLPPGDYGITFGWGFGWGFGGNGMGMGGNTGREVHLGDEDLRLDFEFDGNTITGIVRMPNGDPASGTVVSLLPGTDEGDRLAGLVRAYHTDAQKAWTDNQGVFRIEGVTPGPYHLVVAKEGYAIQVLPVEKREGEDAAAPTVTLARDATVVATVRLPTDETPGYLQLTVADEEGRLIREDEFVRIDPQTRQCHIYGLAPGRYTVVAWADVSPFPCHQDIVVQQSGTTEVELLFKKGSQLGVIVIDDLGTPLSDSEVTVDPGGRASLAVKLARGSPTDGDGSATLQHIPDGEYTVRVRREGYQDGAAKVRIAGSDENVTVTLKPRNATSH